MAMEGNLSLMTSMITYLNMASFTKVHAIINLNKMASLKEIGIFLSLFMFTSNVPNHFRWVPLQTSSFLDLS